MIEIENVSCSLGGALVLDDISLQLPRGGVTALVGPNGAGKSTLLALMARLMPLQTGTIRVDGLSVAQTRGRDLARKLSILRQDTTISSRLRVSELVSFGRFPHSQGRLSDEDRAKVAESLARFDLKRLSERFVDSLSGGQRQRAMVAMSYCQGCDYMLLDEPLNNLDMYYARELMQILRDVADSDGRTVVVVLHDINHASAYADRIVALRDGRLAACGETHAVVQPDTLERIFGFRMQVVQVAGHPTILHHR